MFDIKSLGKAWILAHIWPIILVVIGFLVIGFTITQVGSCLDNRAAEKERQRQLELQNRIQQNKGAANVLAEQREEKINEANKAADNSNAAAANLQRELQTDTRARDSSAANAIREFCTDHPRDSACSNR